MRDVAAAAGVSTMTVSRAFRDDGVLAPETRESVLRAAERLGYHPNALASGLRSGHGPLTLGLVVPDLTAPSAWRLALGVQAAGQARDAVVVIASSADEQPELVRDMAARQVDGCVVLPGEGDPGPLREAAAGLPLVLVDRRTTTGRTDLVRGDEAAAGETAVELLHARGHRHLQVLGLPGGEVRRARLRGARAAARRLGVSLTGGDPATALLGLDNVSTVEALRLARDATDDVPVVGFDYLDFAAALDLDLTLVAVDPMQVAAHAVDLLLTRLAQPRRAAREVVLPHDVAGRAPLRDSA